MAEGADLGCSQPALQVVDGALEAAVVLGGLVRHRLGQSSMHSKIQSVCIYANLAVISVAPGGRLRLLHALHEAVALLRQQPDLFLRCFRHSCKSWAVKIEITLRAWCFWMDGSRKAASDWGFN